MAYLAVAAANDFQAFRQRIVDGELVEFEECLPSFTVSVEEGLFSFCDIERLGLFTDFYTHSKQVMRDVKNKPDLAITDKHALFYH